MRTVVVIVILPFPQLVIEEMNVIGHPALVEELVELLIIDPVGTFDLAIEVRRTRPDVDMPNVQPLQVPVEG